MDPGDCFVAQVNLCLSATWANLIALFNETIRFSCGLLQEIFCGPSSKQNV